MNNVFHLNDLKEEKRIREMIKRIGPSASHDVVRKVSLIGKQAYNVAMQEEIHRHLGTQMKASRELLASSDYPDRDSIATELAEQVAKSDAGREAQDAIWQTSIRATSIAVVAALKALDIPTIES